MMERTAGCICLGKIGSARSIGHSRDEGCHGDGALVREAADGTDAESKKKPGDQSRIKKKLHKSKQCSTSINLDKVDQSFQSLIPRTANLSVCLSFLRRYASKG